MAEPMTRDAKRVRWSWIVLAAALGALLSALTSITQGACYDSIDPAASYCSFDTIIPAAAAPYVWIAYSVLATVLVYRAIRPRTRR
jgi:hypothetical protein